MINEIINLILTNQLFIYRIRISTILLFIIHLSILTNLKMIGNVLFFYEIMYKRFNK